MKTYRWFLAGLALAFVPLLARAYLLMPLPGSQTLDSIRWVYQLTRVVPVTLGVGAVLILISSWAILRRRRGVKTVLALALPLAAAGGVYGLAHRNEGPVMFESNFAPQFARGVSEELPAETMILGIRSGDEAKAYPLRLLAYHHQVTDELDGRKIWVTYCTMCRTGKIFLPVVEGESLDFELVGAILYNSIYRDTSTGSYWYQANGRAATGPLAGRELQELRTDQMTLGRWLELYPESDVLQPDPAFAEGYELFNFHLMDDKRSNPELQPGWQWVLGVRHGEVARGYLWSALSGERFLQDQLGEVPIAVHLLPDDFSHRVWDRRLGGRVLDLRLDAESERLVDDASGSTFGFDGVGDGGELAGLQLQPVASTVEYRHSFESFYGGEIVDGEAAAGS